MKKLILSASVVLMLSSCSSRILDFTVISTKNVDLNGEFVRTTNKVKGVDKQHMVLFIPIGNPDIKTAIDNAIENTPGCVAIENGVIKSSFWDVILYGQRKIVVEGNPLVLKDLNSTENTITKDDFQYVVRPNDENTAYTK